MAQILRLPAGDPAGALAARGAGQEDLERRLVGAAHALIAEVAGAPTLPDKLERAVALGVEMLNGRLPDDAIERLPRPVAYRLQARRTCSDVVSFLATELRLSLEEAELRPMHQEEAHKWVAEAALLVVAAAKADVAEPPLPDLLHAVLAGRGPKRH